MAYKDNFVVAVKSNGEVLREFNNLVRLPLGTNYTLLLKNLDPMRKALASIKIDGQDVLDGNSIIVPSLGSVELKGFMKGSRVTNKFKFIERTKMIEDFRGISVEDGLIEISYTFEEAVLNTTIIPWYNFYRSGYYVDDGYYGADTISSVNNNGITVPGEMTSQDFVIGSFGTSDSITRKIIIQLKGITKDIISGKLKSVKKATTVKTKIQCTTCGKKWKSDINYCGNCSTYLHY